ncbi:MAG TPA: hypothetical protein VKF36_14845 [Syntrophorhabdales bacterium]|nr:hypothetical protein [Syntrophorhabdales bacterium]
MKKQLKQVAAGAITIAFCAAAVLSIHSSDAYGSTTEMGSPASVPKSQNSVVIRDADANKVLAALESGFQGRPLPIKAESKLARMHQSRLRLLSQLSDRVLDLDHPTGSKLALLLMTMLVILS